ncbi:hypothetical protein SPRG_12579 [Saprolegnia parasitica CBS 223.65]|uniref:Transmembrane protein n=1 Tax=Saprolegnia parasitica (strain CBS 223.65) TaxID=695850 RepID=A0A067BVQ1_SAPPC|nr:hypothetical protein SPRG_12579 [Saprolegnia parasitica CBS 223.65]KDO22599.1 hypothetical protein SPRG_12579 [Saprolegnia parasitica CBS 223.65]|eukprot:XP_012206715.1 hypothetical protein SPRG_12579 [Saprolegnia parasitica CBS 223.65]
MNLRLLSLVVLLSLLSVFARADELDDAAFHDGIDIEPEAVPQDGRPQITQEMFEQMLSQLSPVCREAIEANPNDPSQVSDECKAEIQGAMGKVMAAGNPNDPITPEIFAKMMEKLPANCRAEIEANPTDASKLSEDCKFKIQKALSKLLPKDAKPSKAKTASKADDDEAPKKKSKGGKAKRGKKSKDNSEKTRPLLIVLAFVVTAFAGLSAYAYTLYQKQGPVVKATAKKLSKKKLEKTLRKERAAAAM